MNRSRPCPQVSIHNNRLKLIFDDGHILADPVSKLCAALAASSCSELPCMVFLKPYFTQLRWNDEGAIHELLVDQSQLPSWPLEVFEPVVLANARSIVWDPHLFGIECMVNPSLIGFNPCHDLMVLLDKGILTLQTHHSQLVVSMDNNLGVQIQKQLQDSDWMTTGMETIQLCLHCVPDPWTEPLWLFHHKLLAPLMVADTCPMLSMLDESKIQNLMSMISYNELSRAIYAYFSSAVSDTASMNSFTTSIFATPHTILPQNPLQQCFDFVKILANLPEILINALTNFDYRQSSIPSSIREPIELLVQKFGPYGSLAVLNVIRILGIPFLDTRGQFTKLKNMLARCLILTTSIRWKSSDLGWFIQSCVLGTHQTIHGKNPFIHTCRSFIDDRTQDIKFGLINSLVALIGISFYRSELRDFASAAEELKTVCKTYQRCHPGMQVLLICTSELLHCLNTVGNESSAEIIVSQALATLARGSRLHYLFHGRPGLELYSNFSNISQEIADDFKYVTDPTNCQVCQSEVTLEEKSRIYYKHGEEQVLHLGVDLQHEFRYKEDQEVSASELQREKRHELLARLVQMNFDALTAFKIMIVDSYIAATDYFKAERLLRDIISAMPSYVKQYDEQFCAILLRLSKVRRRQHASDSNRGSFHDITTSMSTRLGDLSREALACYLDEAEALICQDSSLFIQSQDTDSDIGAFLSALYGHANQNPLDEDLESRIFAITQYTRPVNDPEANYTSMIYDSTVDASTLSDSSTPSFPISSRENSTTPELTSIPQTSDLDNAFKHDTTDQDTNSLFSGDHMLQLHPSKADEMLKWQLDGSPGILVTTEIEISEQPMEEYDLPPSLTSMPPIHKAVARGSLEDVMALLDSGIDINHKTYSTDLDTAISWNPVIRTWLDTGRLEPRMRWEPLHVAAAYGRVDMVSFLLDRGVDLGILYDRGFSALAAVIRYGRIDVVKILLDRGVGFEGTVDLRPLQIAIRHRRLDIVNMLLERGVPTDNLDGSGSSALLLAATYGSRNIVRTLLRRTNGLGSIGRYGSTPLHDACARGNLAIIQLLLEQHGGIETRNIYGYTPIHRAITYTPHNNEQIITSTVSVLIAHGANVKARGENRETTVRIARLDGLKDVMKLLIAHGAPADMQDRIYLSLPRRLGDLSERFR